MTGTRVLAASSAQADVVAAWEVMRDALGDRDAPSTLPGCDDRPVEPEAVASVVGEAARSRCRVVPSQHHIEHGERPGLRQRVVAVSALGGLHT